MSGSPSFSNSCATAKCRHSRYSRCRTITHPVRVPASQRRARTWQTTPDLTPYTPLRSSVPLDQINPHRGALAEASKKLALEKVDQADEQIFNRILWSAIKGDKPYPGPTRMSALDAKISR